MQVRRMRVAVQVLCCESMLWCCDWRCGALLLRCLSFAPTCACVCAPDDVPIVSAPCEATEGVLEVNSGQSCDLEEGTYTFTEVHVKGTLNVFGKVHILSSRIDVHTSGAINGNGRGLTSGLVGEGCDSSTGTRGAGGSHGGHGGPGYEDLTQLRHPCGDFRYPTTPGAGGVPWSSYAGGAGGAALWLSSVDYHNKPALYVTINGTISMNGAAGSYSGNNGQGGAGAGGSIYINATLFRGTGQMRVNGGDSNYGYTYNYGGGGSGGRVAVYVSQLRDYWSGSVSACGGYGRANYGAGGTMYVCGADRLLGLLVWRRGRDGGRYRLTSHSPFASACCAQLVGLSL